MMHFDPAVAPATHAFVRVLAGALFLAAFWEFIVSPIQQKKKRKALEIAQQQEAKRAVTLSPEQPRIRLHVEPGEESPIMKKPQHGGWGWFPPSACAEIVADQVLVYDMCPGTTENLVPMYLDNIQVRALDEPVDIVVYADFNYPRLALKRATSMNLAIIPGHAVSIGQSVGLTARDMQRLTWTVEDACIIASSGARLVKSCPGETHTFSELGKWQYGSKLWLRAIEEPAVVTIARR